MTRNELLKNFPRFETKNLTLEKIDNVHEKHGHPFTFEELITFYGQKPEGLEKQEDGSVVGFYNFGEKFWYITLKSENKIVGSCQFMDWNENLGTINIAYLTSEDYRERGIMSEALSTIIDYAFEKMNIKEIRAKIHSNNNPAIMLMKKLGFTKTGIGKVQNHHVFGEGEVYIFSRIAH